MQSWLRMLWRIVPLWSFTFRNLSSLSITELRSPVFSNYSQFLRSIMHIKLVLVRLALTQILRFVKLRNFFACKIYPNQSSAL